jgi:hypothetical protein
MTRADRVLSTPPTNTSATNPARPVDPTRRGFITLAAGASVASVGTLAVAAAMPAVAPDPDDAELIELGARLEPLVERYYAARKPWARSMVAAHAERDQRFGPPEGWGYHPTPPEIAAATVEINARMGLDEASDALHAAYEDMEPLIKAINAAPVNSIEGLRAKALVAFYEVAPLCAGETEFSFEDAFPFQQLFTAVAELCGLKGKIAATGYALPDIGGDDSDDEGEDA